MSGATRTVQGPWRFSLPVEHGKIVELARSLRATDAAFGIGAAHDAALLAPPTFGVVASHWGGSNREQLESLGYDPRRVLHGTERYLYPDGPLEEGERLEASTELVAEEVKRSRERGELRIARFRTQLHSTKDWRLRMVIERAAIEPERAAIEDECAVIGPERTADEPVVRAGGGAALRGTQQRSAPTFACHFEPLDLRTLVVYAGASGDFNLVHYDLETAQAQGLAGILVHGMLSAGLIGVALAERCGVYALQELDFRFVGQLWCGQAPTLEVWETGRDQGARRLTFELHVERRPMVTGKARVRSSE